MLPQLKSTPRLFELLFVISGVRQAVVKIRVYLDGAACTRVVTVAVSAAIMSWNRMLT